MKGMKMNNNYEFPILSINKSEYNTIQKWIKDVVPKLENKKLYIFGAGIRGNMFLKILEEAGVSVTGFGDNAIEKQGEFVRNYSILSIEEICKDLKNNVILVSPENSFKIEEQLKYYGCKKDVNYFILESRIYDEFYKEFYRKENIKYICFGDCFFTEIDVDDLNGKSMGELIKSELGEEDTKVLSIHGMCIPSFYYLMKEQIKIGIKPKAVSFIVNIPFCNGIQTKLPQSQHSALLKRIENSLPEKSEEYSQYVKLAEKRSENLNAQAFFTKKVRENENVEKLLTKARYMYELQEDNENIEYLRKLTELLLKHNIKPIPFIPALNYSVGVEWFGTEFLNKYQKICDDIADVVKKYEIEVINMSMMLEKEEYVGDRMTKFPGKLGKQKIINVLKEKMCYE